MGANSGDDRDPVAGARAEPASPREAARDGETGAVPAAEEAGFQLLFAHNPQPMWVYDLETLAFLEVNDAAVQQYGYSCAEFLRLRITAIRPPEDQARLLADVRRPRPHWQNSGEWRHCCKDGRVLDVVITSHTLDFKGRPAALVCAHDITARKRAEEERRLLLERAQEALRVRDAFLQAASHDLRTPLTVLSGHADLLRGRLAQPGPPDRGWLTQQAQALCSGAARLRQMVDELRDMAEVQRGRPLELQLQALDVGVLVRHVAGVTGMRAEPGALQVAAPEGVIVRADAARLRAVLQNVIGNALKFSPAHTPVAVTMVADDATVVVRVQDRGAARPSPEAYPAFAPFSRASTASSMSSLTLGLEAAASIIAQHGGQLTVESEAGEGTTVTIRLPRVSQPRRGNGGAKGDVRGASRHTSHSALG